MEFYIFKYLQILKFHLLYGYEKNEHVFYILSIFKTVFYILLKADVMEYLHKGNGLSVSPVCVTFNFFRRTVKLLPLYESGCYQPSRRIHASSLVEEEAPFKRLESRERNKI